MRRKFRKTGQAGKYGTVVMATEALTTLAFPQPLIDPVLKINITMKQYLHSIYFSWLLHKSLVSPVVITTNKVRASRVGPLTQQDES